MKILRAGSAARLLQTTFFVLFLFPHTLNAQALRGSGKTVTQTFAYTGFDKIDLLDLAGDITVESGQPFAVSVVIDDNLLPLLKADTSNGLLTVALADNERNRRYIENTNIRIRITLPEISVVRRRGNGRLTVKGINGRYFRLNNEGNGDAIISGSSIDELDIEQQGNGDVDARALFAKKLTLKAQGNGDVRIYTPNVFRVNRSGNGDVFNYESGRPDASSQFAGNGKMRYVGEKTVLLNELRHAEGKWSGELFYRDSTADKRYPRGTFC